MVSMAWLHVRSPWRRWLATESLLKGAMLQYVHQSISPTTHQVFTNSLEDAAVAVGENIPSHYDSPSSLLISSM